MMTLLFNNRNKRGKRRRRKNNNNKQFCCCSCFVCMLIALQLPFILFQFQQFFRVANNDLNNKESKDANIIDIPSITTTKTTATIIIPKNITIKNPIFYNVYLPMELPNDVKRVRIFGDDWSIWDEGKKRYEFTNHLEDIINEQMTELQQQFFMGHTPCQPPPPPPLLYTQIGNSTIPVALQRKDNNKGSSKKKNQQTSSYCGGKNSTNDDDDDDNRRRCYQIKYLQDGNEVDTLQELYEYCQSHPTDIVGYIHNKGSYHASYINQKQRRITTKSTIECYKYLLLLNNNTNTADDNNKSKSKCNVCTGHFQVSPQFLSLANMWSTTCTYVNKLIEPVVFEYELSKFHKQLIEHNETKTKYRCTQPSSNKPNVLGKGRYALERWIFSHPNLQPCYNIPIPWNQLPDKWPVEYQSFLSVPKIGSIKPAGFYLKHSNNFGRLEGRLLEYKYLYDKLPPKNSWIWTYYKPKFRQGNELSKCLLLEEEETITTTTTTMNSNNNSSSTTCTMLPTTKPSSNNDDGSQQQQQQSYYYPICNVSKGIL